MRAFGAPRELWQPIAPQLAIMNLLRAQMGECRPMAQRPASLPPARGPQAAPAAPPASPVTRPQQPPSLRLASALAALAAAAAATVLPPPPPALASVPLQSQDEEARRAWALRQLGGEPLSRTAACPEGCSSPTRSCVLIPSLPPAALCAGRYPAPRPAPSPAAEPPEPTSVRIQRLQSLMAAGRAAEADGNYAAALEQYTSVVQQFPDFGGPAAQGVGRVAVECSSILSTAVKPCVTA